ncbi:MAG: DUF4469 domain-containing protein [Treponema sp.]|nr:DUF4469 domain-containing protein [Treponema sp.]
MSSQTSAASSTSQSCTGFLNSEVLVIDFSPKNVCSVYHACSFCSTKFFPCNFPVNKPSQLIARVPSDVAEGSVSLVVRTKYSGSANVLKTLRELRYAYELNAVMAD